jgi:hypothetical protein
MGKSIVRFTALVAIVLTGGLRAADTDLLPPQLPKAQRDNLVKFLQEHEKPNRFIPTGAKPVDSQPTDADKNITATPSKPIKQYMVQITTHRPVPGETDVKQVDVYYYRPHPERGKPGVTIKHTVDLTTGKQVGETEVLVKAHTPISREERAEAVALAREKSPAVQALYKDREDKAVQWEYLQLMVTRKSEQQDPGDRVVRLVFTARDPNDQTAPAAVAVRVNLTKGTATPEGR